MKFYYPIVILILISENTLTQSFENPLKYFPHKTGDMWEYFFNDLEYPDTVQTFNIKDSVDAGGNIYVTQCARRINPIQEPLLFQDTTTYKIDTSFNVFGSGTVTENDLLYKLNAEQGDQWVIYDYSQVGGSGYEIVRVESVWQDELFIGSGIYTTFKAFVYYYVSDSTDISGLGRYGDVLAYNFGLWSKGGGDAIGDIVLRGCVINDTIYGDTTNLITSIKDWSESLPLQFELYPNYPNPFNPITTISFDLKISNNISLIIYNAMGREIKKMIDDKWTNYGNYKIIWDGKSNFGQTVSSGVYYYSLISNGKRITHAMILLK